MSFNRLPYDNCSYKQVLRETTGPGFYNLTTPPNSCEPCHPKDPRVRLQSLGVSLNKNTHLIDIDSELIGISRNSSKCPERKYLPDCQSSQQCGAQTGKGSQKNNSKLNINMEKEQIPFTDCFTESVDTRLNNPPCTLRGTGINRWEWLCKNPQANIEEPFDFQISSRVLSKINHRPCVPRPLDQFNTHPEYNDEEVCDNLEPLKNTCAVPTGPQSVQWQSIERITQY